MSPTPSRPGAETLVCQVSAASPPALLALSHSMRFTASSTGSRPTSAEPTTVAPRTLRAPRVLLVDDEPPVRRALGKCFARRDWEVEEADHGGPALERLLDADAGAPFDLIISDLRMPGVSGVALHDRLASQRPELLDRLVIATGDVVSADAAAFVARTRCVVLEKPFEPSALDAMLRAIVAEGTHSPRDVQVTRA